MSQERSRERFESRPENQALLANHPLDEWAFWEVFGEDENADWGGSHYQPSLGIFWGSLDEVINHAVSLPRFWTWGAGGRIQKRTITILPLEKESKT